MMNNEDEAAMIGCGYGCLLLVVAIVVAVVPFVWFLLFG